MSSLYEIIALSITASLLLLYHLLVVSFSRGAFSRSLHALVLYSGDSFIQKHLSFADPHFDLLAVQSLRNTVLVAIFTGGIAFQSFQTAATAAADASGATSARNLILASFLLLSFLNFALVIRAASHLAYMIGAAPVVPQAGDGAPAAAALAMEEGAVEAPAIRAFAARFDVLCVSLMRAVSLHFSLGFRCIYASVPFTYAASGPTALCVSGGLMLAFSFYSDFGHADSRVHTRPRTP